MFLNREEIEKLYYSNTVNNISLKSLLDYFDDTEDVVDIFTFKCYFVKKNEPNKLYYAGQYTTKRYDEYAPRASHNIIHKEVHFLYLLQTFFNNNGSIDEVLNYMNLINYPINGYNNFTKTRDAFKKCDDLQGLYCVRTINEKDTLKTKFTKVYYIDTIDPVRKVFYLYYYDNKNHIQLPDQVEYIY